MGGMVLWERGLVLRVGAGSTAWGMRALLVLAYASEGGGSQMGGWVGGWVGKMGEYWWGSDASDVLCI